MHLVANKLRALAAEVEKAAAVGFSLPYDEMAITQAVERVAGRLETFIIELSVMRTFAGQEPVVEYSIWDGERHHKAPTLAGAVAMVEAAHCQPTGDALAVASRAATGPMPF